MIQLRKIDPSELPLWNSLLEQDLVLSQFENILSKNPYFFMISEEESIVGSIGLFNLTLTDGYIDYFVREEFRKKGHASDAVSLLLNYAKDELQLTAVKALVHPTNTPSLKIIQKAQFHSRGYEKELLLFEKIFT